MLQIEGKLGVFLSKMFSVDLYFRLILNTIFTGSKGDGSLQPDPTTRRPPTVIPDNRDDKDRDYDVNPRPTPKQPDETINPCSHSIDALTVIRKEVFIFIGSVSSHAFLQTLHAFLWQKKLMSIFSCNSKYICIYCHNRLNCS